DAGEGPPTVAAVEVGGAGEAEGEVGHALRLTAPEVAHGVAEAAVPLRPADREIADLVPPFAHVPGLGDELDLGEHGVLVDDVEEGREPVDVVELPRQRRGEIEAEPVDV